MSYLMRLINLVRKTPPIILLVILPTVVTSCSLTNHTPTWPENLEVTKLSDGGICLSQDSAVRLSEFKAELEKY